MRLSDDVAQEYDWLRVNAGHDTSQLLRLQLSVERCLLYIKDQTTSPEPVCVRTLTVVRDDNMNMRPMHIKDSMNRRCELAVGRRE